MSWLLLLKQPIVDDIEIRLGCGVTIIGKNWKDKGVLSKTTKNPLKFNGFSCYFVEITGLEPATFRLRT